MKKGRATKSDPEDGILVWRDIDEIVKAEQIPDKGLRLFVKFVGTTSGDHEHP